MIRSGFVRSSPERTFESLYRRHVQDVYRYCRAILGRQADAEDATQTTFMNAYRALARGERPRDARAWLQAVALNVCREHYRRAGRRPSEVSLEPETGECALDRDLGDLVLDPPGPEICDVVRGLSCLPFNQRAALVMREFEGRSVAEIAAALDVSASAVESLLFRARRALREQLEEKLTCAEAERAISRQLDGALPRRERGRLRAHLRECSECAARARRVRAQRSALRSLSLLPLPASLRLARFAGGGAVSASASGGSSVLTAAGGSMATKLAVVAVASLAAVGVGYEAEHPRVPHRATSHPARPVSRARTFVADQRVDRGSHQLGPHPAAGAPKRSRVVHLPAGRALGHRRHTHQHVAASPGTSVTAQARRTARHTPTRASAHQSNRQQSRTHKSAPHRTSKPASVPNPNRRHTAQHAPAKGSRSGSERNP